MDFAGLVRKKKEKRKISCYFAHLSMPLCRRHPYHHFSVISTAFLSPQLVEVQENGFLNVHLRVI